MYSQERDPHKVDEEAPEERFLTETILQQGEAEVAGSEEYDRRREPDLETVEVETVDGELPAQQHVVDNRDGDRAGDTVY